MAGGQILTSPPGTHNASHNGLRRTTFGVADGDAGP
jgi:hypothetical protein